MFSFKLVPVYSKFSQAEVLIMANGPSLLALLFEELHGETLQMKMFIIKTRQTVNTKIKGIP